MTQPSRVMRRTKEEINALILDFQRIECNSAQTILVENYSALVGSLVKKYSRGRNSHEDLMQVGMIGLLGAIRRYDPDVGGSFESFLIPTVIGEIKRFLRDKTWDVHVPRRIKELLPKIKKVVDELTNKNQRSPKIHEIAEYLDVSEEEVLEAMEMGKSYQALSVDQSIETGSDGSTVTILDTVGSQEEGFKQVDQKLLLQSVLHVLSEKEKEIIHYTFIENKSQKETGEFLGISQMHVSRLQRRAIQKLRKALAADANAGLNNATT
ncbi:RNA polymerase sigma factor SigB [Bacillus sp. FJAT-29790]|uniref:RNA polymerase sigma factor SigB n=1 Tax=Bacillus sp. FJAT-29790 TaxID=1895002 RepID=UPI001C24E57E|nr:RNA polymerase sigma factor SigB [Bacillus sp. FJAT-29790]MBU8880533.1 RNA polymerase sigma factor SigB [Bacillus sp. FJAT-29790]